MGQRLQAAMWVAVQNEEAEKQTKEEMERLVAAQGVEEIVMHRLAAIIQQELEALRGLSYAEATTAEWAQQQEHEWIQAFTG